MGQEPEAPAEAPEAEAPAPKETPKTFDADYVKTLRNESAGYRKKAQELEQRLTELEERDQSELQKAQGKAAKAEQAKADAEARLIRYEVAAEKQVPAAYFLRACQPRARSKRDRLDEGRVERNRQSPRGLAGVAWADQV